MKKIMFLIKKVLLMAIITMVLLDFSIPVVVLGMGIVLMIMVIPGISISTPTMDPLGIPAYIHISKKNITPGKYCRNKIHESDSWNVVPDSNTSKQLSSL